LEISGASSTLQTIQVEMIKKSQDVVKNLVGTILDDSLKNSQKLQEEVARSTQKGIHLNLRA